jgi:hypothetical protein
MWGNETKRKEEEEEEQQQQQQQRTHLWNVCVKLDKLK